MGMTDAQIQSFLPKMKMFFEVADVKNDGKWSIDDVLQASQCRRDGPNCEQTKEDFEKLDLNKDGQVSKSEWNETTVVPVVEILRETGLVPEEEIEKVEHKLEYNRVLVDS